MQSHHVYEVGNSGVLVHNTYTHISHFTGGPVILEGRVQGQIKLARGRTRFTPLRTNGEPMSAGLDHAIAGHFGGGNKQSQFTITVDELKRILQSPIVTNTKVVQHDVGAQAKWMREVDVGKIIGTTKAGHGGLPTQKIRIFTDEAANLISAFPIP